MSHINSNEVWEQVNNRLELFFGTINKKFGLAPQFFTYRYRDYGFGLTENIQCFDSLRVIGAIQGASILVEDNNLKLGKRDFLVCPIGGTATFYKIGQCWNISPQKPEWNFTWEILEENFKEYLNAVDNAIAQLMKKVDNMY